jgi:hypothetical protein
MKSTTKYWILIWLLILGMAALFSCGRVSISDQTVSLYPTVRARVLENNTITYVSLDMQQAGALSYDDTVWVNLKTHKIDDIDTTTMKCVIER